MMIGVYPEQVLVGKYRVERVLGVGGMGVVVAARHLQLDQTVALKFLHPATSDAAATSRFQREARTAVQLTSEHVARVFDVGALETGAPYMVMEYLDGKDLGALLAERGALEVSEAVDYVLQACDAIAEAHALGIVHRDLKPANLFLTRGRDGGALIKVIDFGISKSTRSGDLTATGQSMLGSPAYMAPEQLRSAKRVDARADVWSLGVILHQLVFGRVPWDADTLAGLSFQIAVEPLPPFPTEPAVPHGFVGVLRCCLEKDVLRRFPDVYRFAVALRPFAPPHARPLIDRIGRLLHGDSAMASAALAAAGTDPSLPADIRPAAESDLAGEASSRASSASTSRRRTTAGAMAISAALAAIAMLVVLRGRAASPPPASTAASPPPAGTTARLAAALPAPALPTAPSTTAPPTPAAPALTSPPTRTAPPAAAPSTRRKRQPARQPASTVEPVQPGAPPVQPAPPAQTAEPVRDAGPLDNPN
jgi:serine/threonine-protein kinase